VQGAEPADQRIRPAHHRILLGVDGDQPDRRFDRGDSIDQRNIAGGEGGDPPVRHPAWAVNWRFIWPLLGTLNGTVFKHQFECRACGR